MAEVTDNKSNDKSSLNGMLNRLKSAVAPLRDTLRDLHAKYQPMMDGKVADYIPELAKADPNWFAISAVTADGSVYEFGDYNQLFTIQSVSKPFVFGLALEDHGRENVLKKVGVEPTGEAFNAIVLDEASNRPFNPMVNAGAIATADLVKGKDYPDRVTRLTQMFSRYCGRPVNIDNSVFMSERVTGHRNRAIGHLMLNFGMVGDKIEESLELYFQQCSVLVNCHDLAVMGATLANAGVNPITGERAIQQQYVKDLLSVMNSCGMYDYAGGGRTASGSRPSRASVAHRRRGPGQSRHRHLLAAARSQGETVSAGSKSFKNSPNASGSTALNRASPANRSKTN